MILPIVYKDFFAKRNMILDQNQISLCNELEKLRETICNIQYFAKLTNFFKKSKSKQGMYIYGGVGRGKTMLMQVFFDEIPIKNKLHIHFHLFMIQIHKTLKIMRQHSENSEKNELMKKIAKDLASKYKLICIDELEINDIADAMIVGKLFELLFEENIFIVVTSNRHPEDLYKDGLQRELFIKFIDIIKYKLDIIKLNNDSDYRLKKISSFKQTYFFPNNQNSLNKMQNIFNELVNLNQITEHVIKINQREIICKKTFKNIAWFEFEEIFRSALGNEDFIAICKEFNIIFINNIPQLKLEDANAARRFINFIDNAYLHKIILICSAETEPKLLYVEGKGAFEFERIASRLIEMQSENYLASRLI